MNKTRNLTFVAMGIVINIVFGTVVNMLKIPLLFLDTIGTVFVAAILGPWYGAVAGGLTNIIQSILTNPKSMPFALVNIAIGLIVGYVCKKREFDLKTSFMTGIILSIVAPLIGTPIAIYVFEGITGDGNDIIFTWLLTSGKTIFSAAFIPRITGNIVDKIATCIFVSFLLKRLPKEYTRKQGNI